MKKNINDKGYWSDRSARQGLFKNLKQISFFKKLFSVRSTDDDFLFKSIVSKEMKNILDVACGGGRFHWLKMVMSLV